MDGTYGAIARALDDYFDGFYDGDVDKLQRIFEPSAHLYSAADGPFQDDPMDAVYERVRARTPPAANRQKRHDRILMIDVAGPEMALAKVQLAIGPKLFTDYLSLLRRDGRWRIVAKAYTYVPVEVETEAGQDAAA
jgi:hypothetical protein